MCGPRPIFTASGITTDIEGNLYIADSRNYVVRKVSAVTGIISTIMGSGRHGLTKSGPPLSADLDTPQWLVFDAAGALYIGSAFGNAIKVDLSRNNLAAFPEQPLGADPVFDSDGNLYFLQRSALVKVSRTAKPLDSAPTAIGTSKDQTLTLTNSGNADLHIEKIATDGANGSDFQLDNRCPTAIAPGDSCTISVVFAPMGIQSKPREAALVIYDDSAGSPHRLALSGSTYTLQQPSRTGWTGRYSFYAPVGKHALRYIPIQNLGAAPLTITAINITGDVAGRFRAFTDCGVTVPALSTCTVTVEFTPQADGTVNAMLTVMHDALADPLTTGLQGIGRIQNLTATLGGTDTDGDGSFDLTVWRPQNGVWYTRPSSRPQDWTAVQWGLPTDVSVTGDFDGDGKTDLAVWRPENGTWYVMPSSNPQAPITQQWGLSADIPVTGDFDGDGKTDLAVWRPGSGTWY
jgi:hypothetical protein